MVVAQLAERSAVRILTSANFFKEHSLTFNSTVLKIRTEKEAGKMAHFKKTSVTNYLSSGYLVLHLLVA